MPWLSFSEDVEAGGSGTINSKIIDGGELMGLVIYSENADLTISLNIGNHQIPGPRDHKFQFQGVQLFPVHLPVKTGQDIQIRYANANAQTAYRFSVYLHNFKRRPNQGD